ncbi:MAG TPA: hypothetical protein VN665_00050 [Candidatus Paceibacterota bacterium]|nr:hypothetical protein [Candidatus Paceibacterota bacterium]
MSGTVQNQLSTGEAFEFGAALMQQLGRDIDPDKARYYIAHKKQLGDDLRKLGIHKMPEFDAAWWEQFYLKHFDLTVDLLALHIPAKPAYACRAIVIVPGITNNQVFDACTKAFKTWRYDSDLNTVCDIVKRPEGPYVVWVRDVVEADDKMKNKSAKDIEVAGTNTLTLKERMILELAYFDETGKHLDIDNWTLCAGSRDSGGRVPHVHWNDDKLHVGWTYVDDRDSYLRARVAAS